MFKKIDKVIAPILQFIVMFCCIGIAIILFIRVIIRFTPLTIELSWTDEVVEWIMAWMIFSASTLIFRDHSHFQVDLLVKKLEGTKAGVVLRMLITILSIIFIASLFYYGILMVMSTDQFSPIMKVPTKFPYSSIPINCALMLFYLCHDFILECGELKK